jgi:DNA processing protein
MAPASDIAREYLRWALIDGVGPLRFAALLEHFDGDLDRMGRAGKGDLQAVRGIGPEIAGRIVEGLARNDVDAELSAAAEFGVRVLCRADAEYPRRLLQMNDPPIVLFVRGELRETDHIALAVVGSRRCTIYGSEQARRFGELLAGAGFTVVSGLARGIDSFAHHGAVDAGGRSLAVLGAGLDTIYPPENRALAEKILQQGAWISELPIRAEVRPSNFPSRNRIIAGLTLGTLVVEAAARSGALITARYAMEYHREVFAIPGRVQDPMSIGTNRLIADGAKLVMDLQDIFDGLGEFGRTFAAAIAAHSTEVERPGAAKPAAGTTTRASAAAAGEPASLFDAAGGAGASGMIAGERDVATDRAVPPDLSEPEHRVLRVLQYEAILQDELLVRTALPVHEALAAITTLELRGFVQRLPGQKVALRAKS